MSIETQLLQNPRVEAVDERLAGWLARHSIPILRIGIGIVFLWFGFLKYIPSGSPAERLVEDTIHAMTCGLVGGDAARLGVATMECLIGLGLLSGLYLRLTLLLLALQMIGTLVPLFIFPNLTFRSVPFMPTLEGQYILKNIVLVAGAMVVGSTVRGAKIR